MSDSGSISAGRRGRGVAAALLVGGLLSGCATNKITGRTQAMIVSDEQAAQQSSQANAPSRGTT